MVMQKFTLRKVRILRNLTFLKILSAIFYKSKVSSKDQAVKLNPLMLEDVQITWTE